MRAIDFVQRRGLASLPYCRKLKKRVIDPSAPNVEYQLTFTVPGTCEEWTVRRERWSSQKRKPILPITTESAAKKADEAYALYVREQWMRAMGMPEDEISESCNPEIYPINLAEELENLRAVDRIKARNLARKQSQVADHKE